MARNNKEIVAEINQPSKPDAGTKQSKKESAEDTLRQDSSVPRSGSAKSPAGKVRAGAHAAAVKKQIGEAPDNLIQPNTGAEARWPVKN